MAQGGEMKVIFVAGSYGSGTSALAGALDKMGVGSLPPHFRTNDPRTPNSFESIAFKSLVLSYADEATMQVNPGKEKPFVQGLRKLVADADPGPANAVMLKFPLASICLPQIIEAVDPCIVLVHRPFEEIEASRIRRNWPPHLGAAGAKTIYLKLFADTILQKKSYLALSYRDLQEDGRRQLQRIMDFCGLEVGRQQVDNASRFIRSAGS